MLPTVPLDTTGFLGGSLRMSADGSWAMAIELVHGDRPERRTLLDHGEYEQDGRELFFVSDVSDDEFTGRLEGDDVRIAYDVDGDGDCETELTFVI